MKHSYTLFRYNFKSFIEMFFASMIFFILLIQMFDIFANLFKYLQNNVPFSKIMQIALLYLPKCIIYSLPIALLYSVSFTMGNFFANNELIVVMASGISVWKFNLPIIIFTLAIVISSFFFEDAVVIPTYEKKQSTTNEIIYAKQSPDATSFDITILGKNREYIWSAAMFEKTKNTLSNLTIIKLDARGNFLEKITAQTAQWNTDRWILKSARVIKKTKTGFSDMFYASLDDPELNEQPDSFYVRSGKPDSMNIKELQNYIKFLEGIHAPTAQAKTELLRRFAYTFIPIIVVLIAIVSSGLIKKNIMLFTMLISIFAAVVYYVLQMVLSIMAINELIPPVWGAFLPLVVFILIFAVVFKFRKI